MAEGEDGPPAAVPGEDFLKPKLPSVIEEIVPRKLTFEEATKCLNTLGKDESGCRYAYIMLTASHMKLTDVSIVLNFKHVLFLDVSNNYLTAEALDVVSAMPFLLLLKAQNNRIETAQLTPMYYLQVLVLAQNQIQVTTDLDQPMLECLDLNHNSIYEAEFAAARLDNLRQLELRSNLLFELAGHYPDTLEKLYLPANKIATINPADLARLGKLQLLHLRENNLQKLDGFSEHLYSLAYLNLRNNKISKLKEFVKLQCLPKLETLVVSGNPLPGADVGQGAKGEDAGEGPGKDVLMLSLLVLLPQLKRINKKVVTMRDRLDADEIHDVVLESVYQEVSISEREGSMTSDFKTESESERVEEEG